MHHRISLLVVLLITGSLCAQTKESLEARRALDESVAPVRALLQSERSALGLNEKHDFRVQSVVVDEHGDRHIRFQQTFRGLRVWGGESIVRTDLAGYRKGEPLHAVLPVGDVAVDAILEPTEAAMAALPHHQGARLVRRPHHDSELVIFPVTRQVRSSAAAHKSTSELRASDLETVVDRYALAYYVQIREEEEGRTPVHTDMMVDARTGEILAKWNALNTGAAKGTGKTLYSGTVTLDTNSITSGYELRDVVRATNPNFYVTNQSGTIYTSTNNVFGDGTTSNQATVAADVMYALGGSFDMMYNCYGWRGINGSGKGIQAKVHLNDDNAYFSGSLLNFGDGVSYFKPLVSIDVVAHELGHAVCANTSNLTYSGESGGLNEANSDIIGTLAEFYIKGGNTGSTVPSSGGNWLLGNDVTKSGSPLRYMQKPSKDGQSPDAWSSTLGNIDVHYSSGPANRMFYFLSVGSTASGDGYSSYLTYGPMTGIGIHKAGAIWMKAQTTKFTSSTKYSGAYTACKAAAEELYGVGSFEAKSVQRAFAAINVTSDIQIGGISLSTLANQSVKEGATVTFTITASNGTTPYKYQWYKNGVAVSGATSATWTFTAAAADNNAKVKVVVTDSANPAATATSNEATLTVTPVGQLAISSHPAPVTITVGQTASFSVAATGGTTPYTYQWYKNGTAISGATAATYTYTPAQADSGAKFKCTVKDAVAATATSNEALLTVNPVGNDLMVNGGFEQGTTSWAGTTGVIGDWTSYNQPAYEGTKAAYLGGNGKTATETLYQTVTIPSTVSGATLSFALHIDTAETGTTVYDKLAVQIRNSAGTVLKTLVTYSNVNAATGYQIRTFDVSAYKGQTIRVHFNMTEDSYLQTSFLVDKVSLTTR